MNLRVPKKKIPLLVNLVGGTKVKGCIFLSHQSPIRLGGELVIDLLNNDEPFFPIEIEDAASIQIVNKKNAVFITTAEEDTKEEEIGKKQTITVRLVDGQEVSGELIIDQPEYKSRVLDFLNNQEGQFFRLYAPPESHYINTNYVSLVIPL
ncbi:MAG: hypothetical protein JXD19_09390 [Deltaproteobacteria bacterium]|nr:hypothetical protein [Deltaproteobacteria bacterium]